MSSIEDELEEMVDDWTGCTDCAFCNDVTNQAFYRLEGDCKRNGIFIVGEAPGADEDRHGVPFIGRSGALLNRLLEDAEIYDYCVANTVCCRPPGNRKPRGVEMEACWPRLQRTIQILRPKVIICAGKVPSHWMLNTYTKMKEMNMKVYDWGLGDTLRAKLIPVYHPSYLLRRQTPHEYMKVLARFELAKKIWEGVV